MKILNSIVTPLLLAACTVSAAAQNNSEVNRIVNERIIQGNVPAVENKKSADTDDNVNTLLQIMEQSKNAFAAANSSAQANSIITNLEAQINSQIDGSAKINETQRQKLIDGYMEIIQEYCSLLFREQGTDLSVPAVKAAYEAAISNLQTTFDNATKSATTIGEFITQAYLSIQTMQ